MDNRRFDRLTASLATGPSRRRLLGRSFGLAMAGLLPSLFSRGDVAAACRKRGKTCGGSEGKCCKRLTCCGGRCRNTDADPNHCGRTCKDCPAQQTCVDGKCTPHCKDGKKNFGETGIDCGGTCLPAETCGIGQGCTGDQDCFSGVCEEIDPGAGKECVQCRTDSECADNPGTPRCISNFCHDCAADVDCPAPGDAANKIFCVAPPDTCPNNEPCVCRECRQGQEETDCPDPGKPVCVDGTCAECGDDVDCDSGQECEEGTCVAPRRCNNFTLDGDETDIDCGGSCPPCRRGKRCLVNADCETGVCRNRRCSIPI